MKKLLLFATFILFTQQARASHYLGAYFEYKVDSVQQELELRLHVILDSAGIPMNQTNFTISGPVSINLTSTGAPVVYNPIGGDTCSGRTYYEKVFVGTLNLANFVMQNAGRKIFAASFPCCIAPASNISVLAAQYIEFSIWPRLSANGGYYYPAFNNIGRNPNMVKVAHPDIRNYLDFGLTSAPMGADSIYHKLLDAQRASNTSMTYQAGFSGTSPLPDKSEDSLNGDNIYFPQQRIISAQARAGSYNSGLYLLRFRNQYFRSGFPYIVDDCIPLVYYSERDTNYVDTLMSEVVRNGAVLGAAAASQTINLNAANLENIQLDLTAFAGSGDSIYLLDTDLSVDTSNLGIAAGTAFGLPSLQSLNPGAVFNSLDTNKLRWTFQAQRANFLYGPKQYAYTIRFTNARCNGFVSALRIQINLEDQAFLYADGSQNDSLFYCVNVTPSVEALNAQNGDYWSPGTWVQDSSASQTIIINNSSGWLYLKRANGQVHDSMYVAPENPRSPLPLQEGSFETIYHNSASPNASQVWKISNLIEVKPRQGNILPILGSGSYSFVNDFGINRCIEYSDTFTVAEDFLWASNYGTDNLNNSGVESDTSGDERYVIRLSMLNDMADLKTIFYYGFKNPKPNQAKTIKLKVSTSYGYLDSASFSITDEEFLEFPVNFDLGPNLTAELEVVLDSGLIYQNLFYSQASFGRNALRFSHMRRAPVGGSLVTSKYRLPLGFRYRSEVGIDELAAGPTYELFPNPAGATVFLNWHQQEETQVNVFSITGQLENTHSLKEGRNVLDLQLKAGVYYLSFPDYPNLKPRVLMVD